MNPDDRRDGRMDRRVESLEEKYSTIITRLDKIDDDIAGFTAIKNQVIGMVSLVKYVTLTGLLLLAAAVVKYLFH